MPTYQYRCTSCQAEFEAVQSMMDSPLKDCSICGGSIVRIIQSSGIVFKGSGFYVTDSQSSTQSSND